MFEYFKGKKTYIAAGIGVVVSGLYAMGYITSETYEAIAMVCGFAGLGFLRMGMQK